MAKKKKKSKQAKKSSAVRGVKKRTKKVASKRTPARKSSNSVDALLKRFAKQRAVTEGQLAVLRKGKEENERRAEKIQQQIDKLTGQQQKLESELASLDFQRDQEVGKLLATLGIQVREHDLRVHTDDGESPQQHANRKFSHG